MANDRLTGKQQYLTLAGASIKTKKISPNVERKLADTTDSGDYDATDDMIYPAQIPVSIKTTIDIEGYYYKSSTPSSVVAKLFSGGGPYAVTFGVATGYAHFSGNYDLSNFKIDSQTEEAANVSFKLESNGKVTPNS